jgi:uncharacterized protein (TIGR03083 family)
METTPPDHHVAATGDLVAVERFDDWLPLARDAYHRLAEAFAALGPDDWDRPTPCVGWSVRDLGGHVVGAMRSAARLRELASQQRQISSRAKRTGETVVDAMTAVQIERTAALPPEALVGEMRSLVEPAVRGRARVPGVVRRRARIPVEIGSLRERWTLEYLNGRILTRDAWLHRIDLADALGVEPDLDDTDRRIVGDVAVEWARRHGQPVDLTLTGPAGGRLVVGAGGPELTVDAVELCRVLSGRSTHEHPLLAQEVPF